MSRKALILVLICFHISNAVSQKVVDLGLSVKWTDRNIGANYETESGFFVSWGELSEKHSYYYRDYKYCHEYENILNCDDIIENIHDDRESHHKKKKSCLNKYIRQQLKEERTKSFNKTEEKEKDDDDLFFLGVLEKAYKDRKRAKSFRSVQVK